MKETVCMLKVLLISLYLHQYYSCDYAGLSQVTQYKGKERKNSYQKLNRSPEERHMQTYGNLIEKDVSDCQNILIKFPFVCLSSRDLFNFW
jgi:hypothetical protein